MANEELAGLFYEIADLLDLEGVPFRPEAYRRAARALEQEPEDLEMLRKQGRLKDVKGLGEALTKKVEEYLESGKVSYLEKLRTQHPAGVLDLLRLEGVGPKTAGRLMVEFGVQSVEDLKKAIMEGRLRDQKGFGEKRIAALLEAAQGAGLAHLRLPLPKAQLIADGLIADLQKRCAHLQRISYAGSLRRRRETVGDLDIVTSSARPSELIEAFTSHPSVKTVRLKGDTKSTVVLDSGLQVDLRVVPNENYGAALQYFTGSKDHNVRLRSMALQKGFSINEYGISRNGQLTPISEEEGIYGALGLPLIPPELREDRGEVDAALAKSLPPRPSLGSLRGEIHIHLNPSAGVEMLAKWIEALANKGFAYGGFVFPGTDRSFPAVPSIPKGVRILRGAEVPSPWVTVGEIDWKEREYALLLPPPRGAYDEKALGDALHELSRRGRPAILAHLETRAPSETPPPFELLAKLGGALEVGITSEGVTLESTLVRKAVSLHVPLSVSSRPERTEDLGRLGLALDFAVRGWAKESDLFRLEGTPAPLVRAA